MVEELTPNDGQAELIWKDRSYAKNKLTFNENLLNGRCGYFAFDNDI